MLYNSTADDGWKTRRTEIKAGLTCFPVDIAAGGSVVQTPIRPPHPTSSSGVPTLLPACRFFSPLPPFICELPAGGVPRRLRRLGCWAVFVFLLVCFLQGHVR